MVPGEKVNIGGRDFTVPPLSLGQLRRSGIALIKQHDEYVKAGQSLEAYETRGKVIHLALTRNYPELPEDEFFDLLGMPQALDLWIMVLNGSGFNTKGEGNAAQQEGTAEILGTSDQSTAS